MDLADLPISHPLKLAYLLFFVPAYTACLIVAWRTWRSNPWPAAGLLLLFLVAHHLYSTYAPPLFYPELSRWYAPEEDVKASHLGDKPKQE